MQSIQEPKTEVIFPHNLTPKAKKVLSIMERDGGITRLVATHYNIGDVRKEIQRIRDAYPIGFTVKTVVTRKDAEGNRYTRWTLTAA